MNDQILTELKKQTELLKQIRQILDPNAAEKGQLGPSELPDKPLRLFIGERDGGEYCWYSVMPDEPPIPFPHPMLNVMVKDVRLRLLTYENKKYEPKVKFDLYLQGDREYIVRSTIDTVWSRKVLLLIPFIRLNQPILIGPKRRGVADEENVVFCTIMQDNLPRVEWDKETSSLVLWAIAKLYLSKNRDEYENLRALKEENPIVLETFSKLHFVNTLQELQDLKATVGEDVSKEAWNMLAKPQQDYIKNYVLNPNREDYES